jgi:hypothetical protein
MDEQCLVLCEFVPTRRRVFPLGMCGTDAGRGEGAVVEPGVPLSQVAGKDFRRTGWQMGSSLVPDRASRPDDSCDQGWTWDGSASRFEDWGERCNSASCLV